MVDLGYRTEKRLFFSRECCPACGDRARSMVEESHIPGRRGIAWGVAPHISQEFRCLAGHSWRQSSYDGTHFHPTSNQPAVAVQAASGAFERLIVAFLRAPHMVKATLWLLFLVTLAAVVAYGCLLVTTWPR